MLETTSDDRALHARPRGRGAALPPLANGGELGRRVSPGHVIGVDRAVDIVAQAAEAHGTGNVTFSVADVYGLEHPDDAFDVVHAHQVLQHLTEPVRALVEMRRVCRPGGVVAIRDADYAAMTWWPQLPGMDRWLDIYEAVARANGGEPDAGRHLHDCAVEAGFETVEWSASTWCFSSDDDRRWWGGLWADRTLKTSVADRAIELGLADRTALERVAAGWQRWSDTAGACFVVPHGKIIARA